MVSGSDEQFLHSTQTRTESKSKLVLTGQMFHDKSTSFVADTQISRVGHSIIHDGLMVLWTKGSHLALPI
jgi:hypothetical protein